jgi:hypothetical protein
MRIDDLLPAGNIIVDRVEGRSAWVRQDLRDTEGPWFYWAFRLLDAGGQRVHVHFGDGEVVGTRGPAISLDRGATWFWLDRDFGTYGFDYDVPAGCDEAWFAFGMVYTQREWAAFVARLGLCPGVLTKSNGGRDVECLELGPADATQFVVVTARHHCCEMMASYALEGLVESVVCGASEAAAWLRGNVRFLVVPFVDKDGVERGDQGKNRRPHDHNRDYVAGLYAETRAVAQRARAWAGQGRLAAFLDLHCPWIRGHNNEFAYQVGKAAPRQWEGQTRFGTILERVQSGALRYRCADNLPFGQAWNTSTGDKLVGAGTFAGTLPGIRLATSFEVPYATANGAVVDRRTARAFGDDIARALAEYLR